MKPYETGDPELDARIRQLANDAVAAQADGQAHNGADLVAELMVSALKLHRDDADRGDLKLVNSAVKEMRYSFLVFRSYRDVPKVTVFGSDGTTFWTDTRRGEMALASSPKRKAIDARSCPSITLSPALPARPRRVPPKVGTPRSVARQRSPTASTGRTAS